MFYEDFSNLDEFIYRSDSNPDPLQLVRLGAYEKALDILLKKPLMQLNTNELYLLGTCYKDQKNYRKALDCYTRLVKIDTKNLYYILGQADCFFHLGLPHKALNNYKKIFGSINEKHSKYFHVLKGAADIYFYLKRYSHAESLYSKCLEINPKCSKSLMRLGAIKLEDSQIKEALTLFRESLRENPDNYMAWAYISMIHRYMGDDSLARANLEKALDIKGDDIFLIRLWVSVNLHMNCADKVIDRLEEVVKERNLDSIRFDLARAFFLSSRNDQAKKYLDSISPKSNIEGVNELSRHIKNCP